MACAQSAHQPEPPRRMAQILVAEDHPINQVLVRKILENQGFVVDLAVDGEAAVALWRADPSRYALILMDIQMPNLDGLEATRRIRRVESSSRSYTPIVALTAHAMVGDEERCLAAGMDAYLSKPIETATLISTLGRFLAPDPTIREQAVQQ